MVICNSQFGICLSVKHGNISPLASVEQQYKSETCAFWKVFPVIINDIHSPQTIN